MEKCGRTETYKCTGSVLSMSNAKIVGSTDGVTLVSGGCEETDMTESE